MFNPNDTTPGDDVQLDFAESERVAVTALGQLVLHEAAPIVTTTDPDPEPPAPGSALRIPDDALPDDEVMLRLDNLKEERTHVLSVIDCEINRWENELLRRLRLNRALNPNARALPHPLFECEIEDQFSAYTPNLDALRAIKPMLPEDEGAKILKFVPEQTTVVPAHVIAGNPVSIAALIRKYAGTTIAEKLAAAMPRAKLGERLKFRRRPEAKAS